MLVFAPFLVRLGACLAGGQPVVCEAMRLHATDEMSNQLNRADKEELPKLEPWVECNVKYLEQQPRCRAKCTAYNAQPHADNGVHVFVIAD